MLHSTAYQPRSSRNRKVVWWILQNTKITDMRFLWNFAFHTKNLSPLIYRNYDIWILNIRTLHVLTQPGWQNNFIAALPVASTMLKGRREITMRWARHRHVQRRYGIGTILSGLAPPMMPLIPGRKGALRRQLVEWPKITIVPIWTKLAARTSIEKELKE